MLLRKLHIFFLGMALLLPTAGRTQIRMDTSIHPNKLVQDVLIGNRVKVRNVLYAGSKRSIAYFADSSEKPIIGEGIMLSTGDVFDGMGPNTRSGTGENLGRRGDRGLQKIARGPTYDAAYIQFEFKAEMDYVVFNFVFASEEYTEYVFSQFNDVFAFLISGPGINGVKNLAVVPRNKAPITVNTVNHLVNGKNYIDNNMFDRRGKPKQEKADALDMSLLEAIEYDGMTTLLQAETRVIPGKVYKIKMAIADVGDGRFDSAVMIEAKSFTSLPKDPVERKKILISEYSDVRRRFQPARVGEEPAPGIATKDSFPESGETPPDGTSETSEPMPEDWSLVVEFAFDSANLRAADKKALSTAIAQLKSDPKARLRIHGHTDNIGGRSYNARLSRRRANAVYEFLIHEGLNKDRVEIDWFGFDKPLMSNESDDGRARNRRVELTLID